MARPERPERSRSALPLRQLSRFCYLINSDMVFGTQRSVVKKFAVGMIGVTAVLIASEAAAQDFVIEETTVAGIQQALQTNARTGRQIVQAYLDRIAAYDHKGPAFNSILTLNPKALAEADRL